MGVPLRVSPVTNDWDRRPDCAGCGVSPCPGEATPADGPYSGWRLAALSAGIFLAPVLLAILGTVLAGPKPERQLIGALAGLALGIGVSLAVAHWNPPTEPDVP